MPPPPPPLLEADADEDDDDTADEGADGVDDDSAFSLPAPPLTRVTPPPAPTAAAPTDAVVLSPVATTTPLACILAARSARASVISASIRSCSALVLPASVSATNEGQLLRFAKATAESLALKKREKASSTPTVLRILGYSRNDCITMRPQPMPRSTNVLASLADR